MKNSKFSTWLLNHYFIWQQQQGQRKSITEFASWLEIPQPVVSNYLNGKRTPGQDNAYLLYLKFGIGVYEVLDMPPPDFRLRFVESNWQSLPDDVRNQIEASVKKALENEKDS
ncbi:MAG: helix-turn-helix transcriptional regulator [Anaerolineae bacterium]|nr:helix-turn-helix transcriptional regulator [Anaerolineae bacterium]